MCQDSQSAECQGPQPVAELLDSSSEVTSSNNDIPAVVCTLCGKPDPQMGYVSLAQAEPEGGNGNSVSKPVCRECHGKYRKWPHPQQAEIRPGTILHDAGWEAIKCFYVVKEIFKDYFSCVHLIFDSKDRLINFKVDAGRFLAPDLRIVGQGGDYNRTTVADNFCDLARKARP